MRSTKAWVKVIKIIDAFVLEKRLNLKLTYFKMTRYSYSLKCVKLNEFPNIFSLFYLFFFLLMTDVHRKQ